MMRPRSPYLAAMLGLTLTACARPEPPAPQKPRDVLLITIDTARADRFSYTGKPGPGTPRIDALAKEGAGFLDVISPAPLTKPAHASIMTGRLPPSHTVRDNGAYRLPASETTLAEVLAAHGYTTGAFIGAQVLDARYGFDQGFGTYDDHVPDPGDSPYLMYAERPGGEVVAAATRWLGAQGPAPVFAWVHLYDPHAPYGPPEPEASRYPSRYDGEIAYVDRVVGDLIDFWRGKRGLDRTLVVVTSDHGESLGEHGEATHGILVHDATLRVPLVIRAPGVHVGRPIEAPVSLIDVMPTVLALLDIPAPPNVQGRNLVPLLRGGEVAWSRASGYAESLYAQLHHGCVPLTALREGGFKLVRGTASELYDLEADPSESRDLAATDTSRSTAMTDALARFAGDLGGAAPETASLDEESRRALESLGYLWASPGGKTPGPPRDPREALVSERKMGEADRAMFQGDVAAAIAGYRAVIALEPRSVDARVRLAQIFVARSRPAEAVTLLEAAVALDPGEAVLHQKLGDALFAAGRFPESLAAYEAGLARHPGSIEIRNGRWRCLNQIGRRDVLLAETEAAIAKNPADGMARYARALACCGQGKVEAYIDALERELAALPGDRTLVRALAKARAEAAGAR